MYGFLCLLFLPLFVRYVGISLCLTLFMYAGVIQLVSSVLMYVFVSLFINGCVVVSLVFYVV